MAFSSDPLKSRTGRETHGTQTFNERGFSMAEQISKNARVGIVTQKFFCTCGGEIKMKLVFNTGKLRNVAECDKCRRIERKPSDFKA
jgi:hypothetical protein